MDMPLDFNLQSIHTLLGEGLLYDNRSNEILWVDIGNRLIYFYDLKNGNVFKLHFFCEVSAIIPTDVSYIYMVVHRCGISEFNRQTNKINLVCQAPYDDSRYRFNDARCDLYGRLWVGTMCLDSRVEKKSKLHMFEKTKSGYVLGLHYDNLNVVNSVCATDNKLYFSDTTSGSLYCGRLDGGGLKDVKIFKQFEIDKTSHAFIGKPDGAIANREGLLIAMYGGFRIVFIGHNGAVIDEFITKAENPTMPCTIGSDLYYTSADQSLVMNSVDGHIGCINLNKSMNKFNSYFFRYKNV